jgi:serine/threonine-protein kinase RsbW
MSTPFPPSSTPHDAAGADSASFWLHNRRPEIENAEERLLGAMTRHGYPDASRFAIRLALEEAIVNAFRHGHKQFPDKPVKLEFDVRHDRVQLAVEDQGPGFNPEVVPDPTLDENLELPTGRGLLLMRAYMARVEYVGRGNRVEMEYHRPAK